MSEYWKEVKENFKQNWIYKIFSKIKLQEVKQNGTEKIKEEES